jgi:CNT family concentrative nucleoside transporter
MPMISERLISVLGLLTVLGIAFAFSNNRGAIKKRTIFWGIGLQLLLALMILKQGAVSFVGFFALVTLILVYVFEGDGKSRGLGLPLIAAGVAVATAGLCALFYALAPAGIALPMVWIALVAGLLAGWKGQELLGRICVALLLTAGFGYCLAENIDGKVLFGNLADKITAFLALAIHGAKFLFGNLADNRYFFPGPDAGWPGFGFQFAFAVLPTIIFFSAFMSVMYYLGVIQKVIGAMAKFMNWTMKTSGSETLSCTANIFVGQTEAPFLVKPFLKGMTTSELHAVMVGGFATIAGGVLAGYVQMGIDAGYLIGASVMAAPAALVLSKLLYPETEQSVTAGDVAMPDIPTSDDVVDAAAAGAADGMKLALNVAAMLIAFISLVAFADMILLWADGVVDGKLLGGVQNAVTQEYAGFFPGSLRTFFGTLLAPVAFLLGVPWSEAAAVGNLLGVKVTLNEFVAYTQLSAAVGEGSLSPRAVLIATYALCGFANFSSVGIQIGGISALEPELRPTLARIGFRALLGGTLASFMTASIAGILV